MEQTIEERETMYGLSATKHLPDSLRPQAVQRMHDIYKAIATEQKQIDIDKAVKWLDDHINDYLFNDNSNGKYRDWLKCSSQAFVDFRKAME